MDIAKKLFNRKCKSEQRIVFIDPGLGGTGYAGWEWLDSECAKNPEKIEPPSVTGVVKGASKEGWEGRCQSACSIVKGTLEAFGAEHVVIEIPRLWSGDAVSQACASRGDLTKLSVLIGGLNYIAAVITGRLPTLIEPSEWKGQLPKDIVIERIRELFPDLEIKDHMADAVGMGMAAMGVL